MAISSYEIKFVEGNLRRRLLTSEVCQHRCQSHGQEDQGDREAFPGAPVLTTFVDVKARR